MAITRYSRATVGSLDALFTMISNALVAAGWTRTVLNPYDAAVDLALIGGETGREEIFQSPGDDRDPSGSYIGLIRSKQVGNASTGPDSIKMFTASGIGGGVRTISSASKLGATYSVTTTEPHGFATGDVVRWGGTDTPEWNRLNDGSSAAINAITVTSATSFDVTGASTVPAGPVSGGFAYVIHNMAGNVVDFSSSGPIIAPADAAANIEVALAVNEFAFAMVTIQSTQVEPYYCGMAARGHVPNEFSQVVRTTEEVVGNDAVQVIAVDETVERMIVGQLVDAMDPNSATRLRTTLRAVSGASVSLIVPSGTTLPVGTMIGLDPYVPLVGGRRTVSSGTGTVNLSTMTKWRGVDGDGSRSWGQNAPNQALSLFTEGDTGVINAEQSTGAAAKGVRQGWDIVLLGTSGDRSLQGPLWNMRCVSNASGLSNFDFGLAGPTQADHYALFPSIGVTNTSTAISLGPNVPNADPLTLP